MLDLGGIFGLHPALRELHAMYRSGEALVVHAVAGPYRVRSHFEAQDCLESGADHRMTSGWLNRAIQASPAPPHHAEAIAIGVSVPLLLRGPAAVANWAPHGAAALDPDLYARIAVLNHDDPVLGPGIAAGLRDRGFADTVLGHDQAAQDRSTFPSLARSAGEMLRADDGPRIAALEIGGWDTHAAQTPRLAAALRHLDAGLAALKQGLGEAWRQTAVLVMTEFGRTVRVNGTNGTDHGTGTIALVLGGAVAGGRVVADWPGLARAECWRIAICGRPATCVPWPRDSWRSISASMRPPSPGRSRTAQARRRCPASSPPDSRVVRQPGASGVRNSSGKALCTCGVVTGGAPKCRNELNALSDGLPGKVCRAQTATASH